MISDETVELIENLLRSRNKPLSVDVIIHETGNNLSAQQIKNLLLINPRLLDWGSGRVIHEDCLPKEQSTFRDIDRFLEHHFEKCFPTISVNKLFSRMQYFLQYTSIKSPTALYSMVEYNHRGKKRFAFPGFPMINSGRPPYCDWSIGAFLLYYLKTQGGSALGSSLTEFFCNTIGVEKAVLERQIKEHPRIRSFRGEYCLDLGNAVKPRLPVCPPVTTNTKPEDSVDNPAPCPASDSALSPALKIDLTIPELSDLQRDFLSLLIDKKGTVTNMVFNLFQSSKQINGDLLIEHINRTFARYHGRELLVRTENGVTTSSLFSVPEGRR
jgi:hypothetical protein